MSKKTFFIILILFISFLAWRFPYALKKNDDLMRLTYFIIILLPFLLSSKFSSIAKSEFWRNIALWGCIFIIIILGYSYRDSSVINKFFSALIPSKAIQTRGEELLITSANDGHFHIETTINGQIINCMIDTGASNIVLGLEDAATIGIDPYHLNYNVPVETANGPALAAKITIKSLNVGSITLNNIPILINQVSMDYCLLGMSFLNHFQSFTVNRNNLLLKP
jgi:aspartyl protease family protein